MVQLTDTQIETLAAEEARACFRAVGEEWGRDTHWDLEGVDPENGIFDYVLKPIGVTREEGEEILNGRTWADAWNASWEEACSEAGIEQETTDCEIP